MTLVCKRLQILHIQNNREKKHQRLNKTMKTFFVCVFSIDLFLITLFACAISQ